MNRVSWKGVVIGNITDIVLSGIVAVPVMIYVLMSAAQSGQALGPPTEVLMASRVFLIWSGISGGLCSILAGYISARIAKHDDVLNGALSSMLCVGSGAYTVLSGGAAGHLGLHLVGFVLSPALGALGGYLSFRRRAQKR